MDAMDQNLLADIAEEHKDISNPANNPTIEHFTEMTMGQTKQHKVLPHLGGRRIYTELEEEKATLPNKSENFQKGSPIEKKPHPHEEKKTPSKGINLDNIPRPFLQAEENTAKGIVYSYKCDPTLTNFIPGSLTRHTAIDKGNSIPRFLRMTTGSIFCDSGKILNSNVFPFGGIVQPFAELGEFEDPIPLSPCGGEQIVRCNRCGAYVNPGFVFLEADTKYKCNLCDTISKLDIVSGPTTTDKVELNHGTYEFIAPPILSGKKAKGHNILFLIEYTENAIKSGLIHQVIATIKATLDYFPDPENTNLGFVIYSNIVQFFSLSGVNSEPQMVNMTDVINPFAPLPACSVLINLAKRKADIEVVLEKILSLNGVPEKARLAGPGSCGGAAVKAAIQTLAQYFGKICWFLVNIPSLGYGALKSRNQSSLYNTEKERSLYYPDTQNPIYRIK